MVGVVSHSFLLFRNSKVQDFDGSWFRAGLVRVLGAPVAL